VRPRFSDDTGSTLPLIAFYAALSLVLVLLVVAATSLYLEHKRLLTLADGAALVGAEAFDLADVRVTGGELSVELEDERVRAAVEEYLDAVPSEQFIHLRLDAAETIDTRSATVTLSAQWEPPVVSLLVPEGFRIEATATARSVFG
jgi:hypothetical protein